MYLWLQIYGIIWGIYVKKSMGIKSVIDVIVSDQSLPGVSSRPSSCLEPFLNGRRLLPQMFFGRNVASSQKPWNRKKKSPSHILTLRSKVLQHQGGWQVVIMMMGESQVRFLLNCNYIQNPTKGKGKGWRTSWFAKTIMCWPPSS